MHTLCEHVAYNFLINLFLSFLVGEGARVWAKSKGISLPECTAEADEVNSQFFCHTGLFLLFYCIQYLS